MDFYQMCTCYVQNISGYSVMFCEVIPFEKPTKLVVPTSYNIDTFSLNGLKLGIYHISNDHLPVAATSQTMTRNKNNFLSEIKKNKMKSTF